MNTTTAPSEVRQAAISVTGMDCASCVAHVEKAIRSVGGVAACEVNLARGRAVVRYDPARTDAAHVAEAISKSGYASEVEDASSQGAHAEDQRLARHRAHARAWLRRAVIGIILWLPVELIHTVFYFVPHSHGHPIWLDWLGLATSTVAILAVGGAFYRSAWAALRQRTSNMDTLIAMGASVAYGYSVIAFGGHVLGFWTTLPDLYFIESTGLLALISLGHYLEARSRDRAGSAIRELISLAPSTAFRQKAGDLNDFEEIAAADLVHGDRVLVRPGDRIPVDGDVVEGRSEVDESMMSGESMPVAKSTGDAVVGGSTNQSGRLIVRATRVGAETALAQIIQLVETAQSSKPPVQRLADRIAAVFVPSVLLVAMMTAAGWYGWGHFHKGWPEAQVWAHMAKAVCSVLIIACPCALGLAVPATLMVGIGRGARQGILIRNIDALQHAEAVDTVVLDKTGTLTQGKPAVARIVTFDGTSEDEVLRLAAAAEQFSEHPLGKAIVNEARSRGLSLPDIDGFESESGLGVRAEAGGRTILAGSLSLLEGRGIRPDPQRLAQAMGNDTAGATIVHLGVIENGRGEYVGAVALADELKADSARAVLGLHAMNLRTVLLTGDNETTARAIARQVGIDEVRAEVKPQQKAEHIRQLQGGGQGDGSAAPGGDANGGRKVAAGRRVAMVGDGINDAPALAAADLGIAIGSGSDIAKETGDIVLVSGSLLGISSAIRLSRATMRKIRQNLFLAFIYNVLAIPLAAMGLLSPLIAAGAMALSDVTVLGNALLLKKSRIDGP